MTARGYSLLAMEDIDLAITPATYCNDPSGTCINGTGGAADGYVWFTNGDNPRHDEYYWLDGELYLQIQEEPGAYNVGVTSVTIDDILEDINTNTEDLYHYGVSFDPEEGFPPCPIDTSSAKVASTLVTVDVATSTTEAPTQ
ncbi:uncharacterized protein BDW70DRAFT_162789 [Aspergillus foveolatus]|uniref:uncharacterized protein n=1 Tax=Aspergillus foveolatus TaxID=210207 RepID=UPI003CCD1E3F